MTFSSLSSPRLIEERKRLGLSQASAAERCGVSREVWGRYERGAAVPGGEVLYAFAGIGADVQYVLTGVHGANAGATSSSQREIDEKRLGWIVALLESAAQQAGRKWPARKLAELAAEIYNVLAQDRHLDEAKVDKILKLVVNR